MLVAYLRAEFFIGVVGNTRRAKIRSQETFRVIFTFSLLLNDRTDGNGPPASQLERFSWPQVRHPFATVGPRPPREGRPVFPGWVKKIRLTAASASKDRRRRFWVERQLHGLHPNALPRVATRVEYGDNECDVGGFRAQGPGRRGQGDFSGSCRK
jgi:hypothetical protein